MERVSSDNGKTPAELQVETSIRNAEAHENLGPDESGSLSRESATLGQLEEISEPTKEEEKDETSFTTSQAEQHLQSLQEEIGRKQEVIEELDIEDKRERVRQLRLANDREEIRTFIELAKAPESDLKLEIENQRREPNVQKALIAKQIAKIRALEIRYHATAYQTMVEQNHVLSDTPAEDSEGAKVREDIKVISDTAEQLALICAAILTPASAIYAVFATDDKDAPKSSARFFLVLSVTSAGLGLAGARLIILHISTNHTWEEAGSSCLKFFCRLCCAFTLASVLSLGVAIGIDIFRAMEISENDGKVVGGAYTVLLAMIAAAVITLLCYISVLANVWSQGKKTAGKRRDTNEVERG